MAQEAGDKGASVITTKTAVLPAKDANGDQLVKPFDTVIIYATDKAVHVEAGKEWEVNPALAEKMIAAGKATEKAPAKK